ncbi:hypothetical protein MACK_001067 [Theileria orientalis]|uniref:Uncharacterized protein n=1 Tax=Theileria orientalis TaxID=68886 RepID=A0A976MC63_THEOR|nr:hypothetical protein MACK_001067 [Theileria orientalis]
MRKDNDGCWWAQEKLKYKNYQERVSALTSAKEGAEKNTLNTVIIDKYTNYICGRNVKTEEKDTFNIYTHQFEKSQSLNLIFEVQNIKIGSYDLSQVTATKVEVYYLKAGGKNDDKPFLLVFDKDGDGKIKKVYHFQITRVFKDWQEFTLVEKLDEKLQKISDKGKCTKELGLLRTLVYRILTTDDDDVHVKPPDATEEVRPAPTSSRSTATRRNKLAVDYR